MSLCYNLSSYYEQNQVQFRRPMMLGSYAVKKGLGSNLRTLVDNPEDFYDKYSLKEFKRTGLLDLREGFDRRPPDELYASHGKIDKLLLFILSKRNLFRLDGQTLGNGKLKSINTDFVSFRGIHTLLMNVSYDFGTAFTLHCEKFNGTHYLQLEKNEEDHESNAIFTYAGRRFELYLSEDFGEEEKLYMNPSRKRGQTDQTGSSSEGDELKKRDEKSKMSEYEKHTTTDLCFVYRSRINEFSLCYGAEMDAVENVIRLDGQLDSCHIKGVELKTSRKIMNQKQERNFRKFKTLKYYTQSYLVNVRKITVGFWRDEHIVDEIKEYSLQDLKNMSDWSEAHCLYQFHKILTFIRDCFLKTGSDRLKFIHAPFSYKIVCDDRDVQQVVPDFYKNEFAT